MFYKITEILQIYVNEIYSQMKPVADLYGIFRKLEICFSEILPLNYEGIYCFSDKRGYHYCCIERGEITLNNITNSLFEITYWITKSFIFNMASDFEAKNRVEGQDPRRIIFRKEIELFEAAGENYRKRVEIDINEILKIAPYNENFHL